LGTIAPDTAMDRYGQGGVVAELERYVATLLGKEAALFFPSGTMAQQIALRVHADRRGRRDIVFHPYCHLNWHEEHGYERLHNLHGVPAGPLSQPLSLASLSTVAAAPAALLIELPQRDLGGVLPDWDELVQMVDWAHHRGAAAHLDGARLWESTPYYGKAPSDIAALFDTVYVSFYKGIGGIAGCCLAGPADVISEARAWRTRHGGRLVALWPYAASALALLPARLSKMPRYFDHARAIARALAGLPGVEVLPEVPQAPMMHLALSLTADQLLHNALLIAERHRVWTFAAPFASDTPHRQRIEFTVGDATLDFTPDEVRSLMEELAGR
jgi:threonine aldolase